MTIGALGRGQGYSILVMDDIVGGTRKDKTVQSGLAVVGVVGDEHVIHAIQMVQSWLGRAIDMRHLDTRDAVFIAAQRWREANLAVHGNLRPLTGTDLLVCHPDEAVVFSYDLVAATPTTPAGSFHFKAATKLMEDELVVVYGPRLFPPAPLPALNSSAPFGRIVQKMLAVQAVMTGVATLPYTWSGANYSGHRLPASGPQDRVHPFVSLAEEVQHFHDPPPSMAHIPSFNTLNLSKVV